MTDRLISVACSSCTIVNWYDTGLNFNVDRWRTRIREIRILINIMRHPCGNRLLVVWSSHAGMAISLISAGWISVWEGHHCGMPCDERDNSSLWARARIFLFNGRIVQLSEFVAQLYVEIRYVRMDGAIIRDNTRDARVASSRLKRKISRLDWVEPKVSSMAPHVWVCRKPQTSIFASIFEKTKHVGLEMQANDLKRSFVSWSSVRLLRFGVLSKS